MFPELSRSKSQHAELATRPRVLVVQPDPVAPLDKFEQWLLDSGLTVRLVRPFAREVVPASLDEDALIVLGGDMSANDDVQHPWLADVRRLLTQATALSLPTLGICLGGQLLAQTFGSTVTVGDRGQEAGVVRIRWRPDASADPLLSDLPTPFLTGAMHDDVVRALPDGVTWLGSTDQYPNQAFRYGRCAWGLQFHPEVSAEQFRKWVLSHNGNDSADDRSLRRSEEEFAQLEAEVTTHTRLLADRFAAIVQQHAEP